MLLTLKRVYGNPSVSGWQTSYPYTGYAFDTDTLSIVPQSGVYNAALLEPRPTDVNQSEQNPFWTVCANQNGAPATDYSGTAYYHFPILDSFYSREQNNLGECGYTPPPPPSPCTIEISSVAVLDDTATVNTTGAIGRLEYSIDGGATRQASNRFTGLAPGTYTATVFDLGSRQVDCADTMQFTIEGTQPGEVPTITALPELCLSGNPIIVQCQAPRSNRQLEYEIYAESSHLKEDYTLIYAGRTLPVAGTSVEFSVNDILEGLLSPELKTELGWNFYEKPLLNWFVRVAQVLPQTGRPDVWATSTLSTVLLGGLPPEPILDGKNYFNNRLVYENWLDWQPERKTVSRNQKEIIPLWLNRGYTFTLRISYYENGANVNAIYTERISWNERPIAPPPPSPIQGPGRTFNQQMESVAYALNLKALPESITTVQLQLLDSGGRETGYSKWLDIDDNLLHEPRQLVFFNSVSGWDCVNMFGRLSIKQEVDRQLVRTNVPLRPGLATDTRTRQFPAVPESSTTYQLSSGYLDQLWLDYMPELLRSREIYEVVHGQYRQILLTGKEAPIFDENGEPAAMLIEYKYAFSNSYYADYATNNNRDRTTRPAWR